MIVSFFLINLSQDNPVLFCLDFCMKVQYLLCKIQDIIYLVGRIVNVWEFCLLNVPLLLSCLLIGANHPTGGVVLQPVFLPWSTFGVISVLATIYSNRIFSIYITIGVTFLFLLLLLLYDLLRIF